MTPASHFRHARFTGDCTVELTHSPIPQVLPGEVIVSVRRTALCGSDNRLWRDGAVQIPGHEIFGVVEQAGHMRHGERVCVYIPVYCGYCTACTRGHTQSCTTGSVLIGWNRDGGFGEYVRVPEQCLLPVPDHIEDRLAPLLLDTIGTSAHAVRTVQRLLGDLNSQRILITGAGPIGMGVLIALQDSGCEKVTVYDPNTSRSRFAENLGAQLLDDHTNQQFDAIFECSGAHAARDDAITRVAAGGAVVLIGENSTPWPIQEGPVFRRKDFALLRSFYFPVSEHNDNIALLLRQQKLYAKIADTDVTLDQLAAAYRQFVAGETMKPLLTL
ncbi:hypothetical protein AB833_01800 [Chromatiales bacterium (ex Bugula neritina AB1)]|nr:hypothetical protein AB833_01800 [Chromatiales bacterium (ex Bugula neritina AB1)]